MNFMTDDDDLQGRLRQAVGGGVKPPRPGIYTAKDFQLEVLSQLAEMQAVTEALDALRNELKAGREHSNLLRFDGRTLVAIGAIALSITGFALQDARNSSRRDADIETTKARVTTLEMIEQANTEGRIKTQVQISDLHDGLAEIEATIQGRDGVSKKAAAKR
jgi:hypothetical protein